MGKRILTENDIDQTYNPKSENAQSGIAVAEAVANITGGNNFTNIIEVNSFAELQSALTNGYKNIVINGNFTINDYVRVPQGTTIIGNGSTVTRAKGFEGTMFMLQANCKIQDLTIDGNRTAMVSPRWETTHEITTNGNCVIDNVTIVNGNECIIAYGNDNVIQNCNIRDCGGNGIHFSGGKRTRVLNNTIINSNIIGETMEHNGGCISWSAECEDVTAIGNWLENGYCGFGYIGGNDNSRLKIIGNTVKNCQNAIHAVLQTLNPVKNVVIQSNHFIDSKIVYFNNTDNYVHAKINGIIDGNIFENTGVSLTNVTDFVITNNTFNERTGLCTCPISCNLSSRITISNNHCVTYTTNGIGIYLDTCYNIKVLSNYARATRYGVYCSTDNTNNVIIDSNIVREIYSTIYTGVFNALYGKNLSITNNEFVGYRQSFESWDSATILNNRFYTPDASTVALLVSRWHSNVLFRDNRTTGVFSITTSEPTLVNDNNAMAMEDTVFANLAMNLTNITSGDVPTKVTKGDEFIFTLIADDGYSLPENITITNNGVNCSIADFEYDKTTGEVTLYSVVGDVVVTANAQ